MSCSNFKLNLPTDIPWKRICVSRDMIDEKLCDRQFPYRWRSSIAVFEYEPEEEHQNYDDMTISYLKVSCTITGYQENPKEIGLNIKGIRDYWRDQPGIENYLEVLQKYYACYGAILEVAIAPKDKRIPVSKYPYFLDFNPKKRELYELVSETGEVMSRSLNNVEIGKSNSSLMSHEVVDIDKGFSIAGAVSGATFGAAGSYSQQGESGSRNITQSESQNLRNTDTSQEMREVQSHTTQLSQMYHQLDSYHIGTNRTVFFIHPRPHTIETEHTFVNGPRNIEGIQEFMFVVARPKEVKETCVEAYLETGHIGKIPVLTNNEQTDIVSLTVFENFNGKSGDDLDINNDDNSETRNKEGQEIYTPPPGWEILSVGGITRNVDRRVVDCKVKEWDRNHLILWGKVSAHFQDDFGDNQVSDGRLEAVVTVTIQSKKPKVTGNKDVLFITGRGLCCCDLKLRFPERIIYETKLKAPDFNLHGEQFINYGDKMPIRIANKMGLELRESMIRSRNDIENQYDRNGVNLPQAHFANQALLTAMQNNKDKKIDELKNLRKPIKDKVLSLSNHLRVGYVLKMPIQMQQDLFDLTHDEVMELRNSLSGFNHKITDKKIAWLTPEQQQRYHKHSERKYVDVKTGAKSKS